MDENIPDEVRSLIGEERVRQCKVTSRDIKRFAQAIGDPDPLYYDEAYARGTVHGGIVAPVLFYQSLTYDDAPLDRLPPDGSPVELNVPVPAGRTVGGGSQYEFFRRARPGDDITVRSKLNSVYTKQGRSGLLYLIEVVTAFYDNGGKLMARETATYIKRA